MMNDPYGQTNPRPASGAAAPPRMRPAGQFTPRMLLAVAALYNPAILLGYVLYLYGPDSNCVLGGLCNFGSFSGIIQLFLLMGSAGAFGAVIFVPLWWLLDEGRPARDSASRIARDMARFVTIRPLMVGYGTLLLLLLIVGLVLHRVPPPLFLLVLSSGIICLWCAAAPEFTVASAAPPPPQPQRARDASDSAFLRDSPPSP